MSFNPTNSKQQFTKIEEEIIKFWQKNKIFEKSLKKNSKDKSYVFFDGPPFATGTPHYGHLVASLMKDAIPRYWTMKGYYVERKWGWDCHGLPIENIVEKELGFKSKKDIEGFGVDKFNDACRNKVLMYAEDWKKTITRFGRWVDMDNAYKTMNLDYMESVWWVFKKLWDKELIYEDYKSMHVCPRCETTLSQQEVSEGYKDIKDISVTAKFELLDEPGTFVLAWTTTPWTLPGNVALAVGADINYVKMQKKELAKGEESELYIIAKARLEQFASEYKIVEEFKGLKLENKKYLPLFEYYIDKSLPNKENLYKIVTADFVTIEDGTGIVHIAPAYGEDDMNLGRSKNLVFIQNVGLDGRFKEDVVDFANMHVKPLNETKKTDLEIIKFLSNRGLVFATDEYEHSYPHCWRCDTPLINYATSSWFVAITKIKKEMLDLAKKINWSPMHIKDGRFGQWLEGARDWSISRQRFWASCIPIWRCQIQNSKIKNQNCGNVIVIGSVAELEKLSGQKITDLHKDLLDKVEFNCPKCGGKMKRIPDVLDCWFESGSMPYAQTHYPFGNKDKMEKGFPAEFIAEGLDQTRAWFYYLHALSTAIKSTNAFNNVIVNGIVLAEDGKKMSKKLKNYPEPEIVIEKFGSDALRYYLLSSPVMQAENINFSELGVKEVNQKIIILLTNILNFYSLYADETRYISVESKNILDQWILAKLDELILSVTKATEEYNLPRAVRPIGEFIDELSTWWLRRSRERLKSDNKNIKREAVNTLQLVLGKLSIILAPFMPFLAEYVYGQIDGHLESVHLEDWPLDAARGKPAKNSKLVTQPVSPVGLGWVVSRRSQDGNSKLLDQMQMVREVVEKAHALRAEAGIKVRQPLALLKLQVTRYKLQVELLDIIADEVNVKKVELVDIKSEIELDTNITLELKQEGLMREFVRQIQNLRKQIGLTPNDKIEIFYNSTGNDYIKMISRFSDDICKLTVTNKIVKKELNDSDKIDLKDISIQINKI